MRQVIFFVCTLGFISALSGTAVLTNVPVVAPLDFETKLGLLCMSSLGLFVSAAFLYDKCCLEYNVRSAIKERLNKLTAPKSRLPVVITRGA